MGQSFIPTADNQRALRDAFGCFATGVTVITTMTKTGPIGITANSFSSVSLEPPLVSWCPAKVSDRLPAFLQNEQFAIHVLKADQSDLAQAFADHGDAFDSRWRKSAMDVPIFDDCLCVLECRRVAQHDAGDHVIMIGEVFNVQMGDGEPLVFGRGDFGRFRPMS